MEAVDVSMRLVQVSPEPTPVAVNLGGTAYRCAEGTSLGCFDLLRDVGDILIQCVQQCAGLRDGSVVDHRGILSPVLNVPPVHPASTTKYEEIPRPMGSPV
jgi:hypothetical protein